MRIVGKLDIYTVSRLTDRLARHDATTHPIVLDVSGVTLIDSAGLVTLVSLANRARRGDSRLELVCTPAFARLLDVARLTDAFDLTITSDPPDDLIPVLPG